MCQKVYKSVSLQAGLHFSRLTDSCAHKCLWPGCLKSCVHISHPGPVPSYATSPALTCSQRLGKRQKALLCKLGRLSKISFWSCLSYLQMSAVCYSWALLLSLRQFVGSIWKWRWI